MGTRLAIIYMPLLPSPQALSAADNQNWVYDFLLSDWLTQNQNIVYTAKGLSSSEMASVKVERGEVLCRRSKESQFVDLWSLCII